MIAERTLRYPRSTYSIEAHGAMADGASFTAQDLAEGHRHVFQSLWALLLWMEQSIDEHGSPQKMFKYRTWGRLAESTGLTGTERDEPPPPPAGARGGATFIVQVLCRQNATWQGTIQWVQGRQSLNFRSEHELIRLMDEAMRTVVREPGKANPVRVL